MNDKSRIQSIIRKIEQYRTEINNMDMDVRLYIDDKSRYPYPQFEELIQEIYRFEREVYNFNNSEIQFRLEGLMDSLLINKRIWERRFDEETEARRKQTEEQDKIVNMAFKASEEIWSKNGVEPSESRQLLNDRLIPEYTAAKSALKENQKIIFAYDTKEQKINIKIKDTGEPGD